MREKTYIEEIETSKSSSLAEINHFLFLYRVTKDPNPQMYTDSDPECTWIRWKVIRENTTFFTVYESKLYSKINV